jgi:hypothetical protein
MSDSGPRETKLDPAIEKYGARCLPKTVDENGEDQIIAALAAASCGEDNARAFAKDATSGAAWNCLYSSISNAGSWVGFIIGLWVGASLNGNVPLLPPKGERWLTLLLAPEDSPMNVTSCPSLPNR